jgi:hypothetical protein
MSSSPATEPSIDKWYQSTAPPIAFTATVTVLLWIATYILYLKRVRRLSQKFSPEEFHGTLKLCTKLSAYMDHYEAPGFATLRVSTKGFFILSVCQYNFHLGFWIMIGMLVIESSLDTLRVLLAYWRCKSVKSVVAIVDEEARDLRSTVATTLEPTNVYEDLTRPQAIGVMVFVTQVFLITLVLRDTYQNTMRTCFDGVGDKKCPILSSMGKEMGVIDTKRFCRSSNENHNLLVFYLQFQAPMYYIYWESSCPASFLWDLATPMARRSKTLHFG